MITMEHKHKLLANATVTLEGKYNQIVQETNENGQVNFTQVPPDTYTVLIQKEGYQDKVLKEPIIIKENKFNHHVHQVKLEKTINKPKKDKEKSDTRTLIIKTRQPNIKVSLISYDTDEQETLTTNDEGNVIFEEIPYGNYEININTKGFYEYTRDILVNSNNRLIREIPVKLEAMIMEE